MQSLLDHPEVVAAFLSAVATLFAAIAAWRGPKSAAKLAEALRRESEKQNEAKRLKLFIFTSLMQERAYLASTEAVRALNLIDVVFHDSRDVREAWSDLFLAFNPDHQVPRHAVEERVRRLLRATAEDIGISDSLRTDDLGRIYHPTALAEEEELRRRERQNALRRLQGDVPATENAAVSPELWPPKPD